MEISTGMFYSIMKVFEIAHVTSSWIKILQYIPFIHDKPCNFILSKPILNDLFKFNFLFKFIFKQYANFSLQIT